MEKQTLLFKRETNIVKPNTQIKWVESKKSFMDKIPYKTLAYNTMDRYLCSQHYCPDCVMFTRSRTCFMLGVFKKMFHHDVKKYYLNVHPTNT